MSESCLFWAVLRYQAYTCLHTIHLCLFLLHASLAAPGFFTQLFLLLWSLTSSLLSYITCLFLLTYSMLLFISCMYVFFNTLFAANYFFASLDCLSVFTIWVIIVVLWFTYTTFPVSPQSHLPPHLGEAFTYTKIFSWLSLAAFSVYADSVLPFSFDIYLNFVFTIDFSNSSFTLPV